MQPAVVTRVLWMASLRSDSAHNTKSLLLLYNKRQSFHLFSPHNGLWTIVFGGWGRTAEDATKLSAFPSFCLCLLVMKNRLQMSVWLVFYAAGSWYRADRGQHASAMIGASPGWSRSTWEIALGERLFMSPPSIAHGISVKDTAFQRAMSSFSTRL